MPQAETLAGGSRYSGRFLHPLAQIQLMSGPAGQNEAQPTSTVYVRNEKIQANQAIASEANAT